MKKILYTLLAGVMVLASCSKSAEMSTALTTESTTFTLSIDEPTVQAATAKATTRATSTIAPERYVMEVWSENGEIAENVFDNNGTPTNRSVITSSSSSFTVTLDKTKAYTCLFWADDNATFDVLALKAVALNTNKEMTEAYFAKVDVEKGRNPSVAVTLSRAVAKIVLSETEVVKITDNLALKLTNIYPTFSVLEGTVTGAASEWTKTVNPVATTGIIATLYFFAKPASQLTELTFTYASEQGKTVSNVPYQQNYKTNINGAYSSLSSFSFMVSADDDWESTNNDVVLPHTTYAQPK